MNEMTDNEYKKLMYDNTVSAIAIMKRIEIPKSVYKYRKFVNPYNLTEETYWEDALDGKMYFSLPAYFNRNDSDDCVLEYDVEKCKEKLLELIGYKKDCMYVLDEVPYKETWNEFTNLIENMIRGNIRIGCFTTVNPDEVFMWEDRNFGSEHQGFCIEYEVDEQYFYPNDMVFLKVLYEKEHVDMTDVVMDVMDYCYKQDDIALHHVFCSNAYNFALCKKNNYKGEEEWRIIVVNRRWESYFDIDGESKKDFANKMKAIYFGADSEQLEFYDDYKKYALEVSMQNKIPLYQMKRNSEGGLFKVRIY